MIWGRTGASILLTVDGIKLPLATWYNPGLPTLIRLARANPSGMIPGPRTAFALLEENVHDAAGHLEFEVPIWSRERPFAAPVYPYRIFVGDSEIASGELRQDVHLGGPVLGLLAMGLPLVLLIVYLMVGELTRH